MTEPVATRSIGGYRLNLVILRQLDTLCHRTLAGERSASNTLRDIVIGVVATHEHCLGDDNLCPTLWAVLDKLNITPHLHSRPLPEPLPEPLSEGSAPA